jgi:hypothetical protein
VRTSSDASNIPSTVESKNCAIRKASGSFLARDLKLQRELIASS